MGARKPILLLLLLSLSTALFLSALFSGRTHRPGGAARAPGPPVGLSQAPAETPPRFPRSVEASLVEKAERDFACSRAAAAYLAKPGQALLDAAMRACAANSRDDMFVAFLAAFCAREKGGAAQEERIIATEFPGQRSAYRFIFREHRDKVAEALDLLPAKACLDLRDFSPGIYRTRTQCLFYGTPLAREDGRVTCPNCDGLWKSGAKPYLAVLLALVRNGLLSDARLARLKLPPAVATAEDFYRFLELRPGQVIADIGCGPGFHAFAFARCTGERGTVYAEEIDRGLVDFVAWRAGEEGYRNIVAVLGDEQDIRIPPGILDVAFLSNLPVVFEDDDSREFLARIGRSLKRSGTLIVVMDYFPPGLTSGKIAARLEDVGFSLTRDRSPAPGVIILVFRKS